MVSNSTRTIHQSQISRKFFEFERRFKSTSLDSVSTETWCRSGRANRSRFQFRKDAGSPNSQLPIWARSDELHPWWIWTEFRFSSVRSCRRRCCRFPTRRSV